MHSFYGLPIVINDHLGWQYDFAQFRFPRSKKKRIRNKWKKDRDNWRARKWQLPEMVQIGGTLFCNSTAYKQLKRASERHQDARNL